MNALIHMKLDIQPGIDANQVMATVDKIKYVKWAQISFGSWDAVAYAETPTDGDMANLAISIASLPEVTTTNTEVLSGR